MGNPKPFRLELQNIKLNFEKLKMCCFEINYLLYLENWAIILVELI
jgi:hypothetical protein